MLAEKKLPFEEVNVDLGNKPAMFVNTYAEIALDPEARAKAPILQVGDKGSPDYLELVESEVIARYLEDAFPTPPMRPASAARRALGHLFVTTFMELVEPSYMSILFAKTQAGVDDNFKKLRRGLFAVEVGLRRHQRGERFFDENFGLVEALCGPFVVRMLEMLKTRRGVDLSLMKDLPATVAWMEAIRVHPSVVETTPHAKSLVTIAPYLEPFYKGTVSSDVLSYKPGNSATAEAAFAATIDQGLMHKGKAPRQRAKL